MVEVASTSPYLYLATAFFAVSSLWSDLFCIRLSLTFGFLGLVLGGLSGYDSKGSFSNIPLKDGVVDITLVINMCLFLFNTFLVVRLGVDEIPRKIEDEEEAALFYFFRHRCGLTTLQFKHIYKHGRFLQLAKGVKVPDCHRTLYLLVEGKATCNCLFNGKSRTPNFIKRSGEFFDVKMFNLFTFPVGFDNADFQATTLTETKLFAWDVTGLIAMRELKSPLLTAFWEFTVLRSLSAVAVRHHLKKRDTLYDSLLIPEDKTWLNGSRSRDFLKREKEKTGWERIKDQLRIFAHSIHPIPPQGVRHRPGILETNPMQHDLESICKGEKTRTSLFPRLSKASSTDLEKIPSWGEESV